MDCKGNFHDNISFVLSERIWEGAWLRHYRFKTIDEYINLKLKRLYPNVSDNIAKKWLTIKDFFKYNKFTNEKIEYYKKCMGINDIKTLICCIGKNENRYVREYVEWYKHIGVSHIRIYDNNDIDGEHFEEVINDYIENGYVDIVDYRGRKLCQLQAYEECYKELGSDYDWVLFIDCGDEYLDFFEYTNINDYLSEPFLKDYDIIHINLMTFGDNDNAYYSEGLLRDRFPYPIPYDKSITYLEHGMPESYHVSSIVRGGLDNILWRMTPHTPYPCDLKCCNEVGKPVKADSPFTPYSFSKVFFKHYTTKTAEEYCDKMKRGFPDFIIDDVQIKNLVETRYFRTNKVTKEKVQVFKDKLGIDMSYLLPYEGKKRDDIKIYSLCYSKKEFNFLNDSVITPLQVGAANGTDICEVKDNTGDNISDKNYFYIENTGIYWIWRNVKDTKYKGQMQYRRPLEGVDETMDFDDIFSKYKVITCTPFNHPANSKPTKENPMFIPAQTVEQGYAFSNCIDDLNIIEMVIDLYYPEYKESYKKYIKNGENLYYSNGFIMKSEDYDKYCEFLFDCLAKYQQFIDVSTPEKLMNRVIYNMEIGKYPKHMHPQARTESAIRWQMSIGGFLSERIWTLWLLHNFKDEEILKLPYNKMEENMYT